jgi:ribonuclease HII
MSNPEPGSPPRRRKLPPAASREWEQQAWAEGFERVAGVDEAGRGALAGPVVAAAVIMPPQPLLDHVTDSKLLPPADREALAAEIRQVALAWAVAIIPPGVIDAVNILQANHRAMREALRALQPAPALALIDGHPLPGSEFPQRNLIGGDRRCYCIAAASILAKTTRDQLMVVLDGEYPAYGFAGHKGYGAATHLAALRRLGPCPAHRLSFAPCAQTGQPCLDFTELNADRERTSHNE